MNLLRATSTIGGLTLVSRIFGFARDMLLSRFLGAGMAADAFFVAFRLPNIFRRLFGEGAFSAAYVPMFSQRLHGEGGLAAAKRFSEDVLSVFLPILLLFTAAFEIFMPGFVWLMASGYARDPQKFALTVELTRITFPYLMLISMVSLLSGILNSMSKFAAAAAAPILLNIAMMTAILLVHDAQIASARAIAVAVTVAGIFQFGWMLWAVKRSGLTLRLRRPRLTSEVRELGRIIMPATFGAGIYQLSQLVDTFFATRLPEGSLSYLNYADRLNQLPLGVIGAALGTAILPALARHIGQREETQAARIQSNAIELAMLITVPAAIALGICAIPLVTAFFRGGHFSVADAAITGHVLACLVGGLPAYVLVKVLTPGFYARKDTKTPVKTALIVLAVNIVLNFVLIRYFGVVGLALATAICAWLNCAMLYAILWTRGHFRIALPLWARLARQLLAALAMAAVLVVLKLQLGGLFGGSIADRVMGIGALVGAGGVVYFGVAWVVGAFDPDMLANLKRRRRAG